MDHNTLWVGLDISKGRAEVAVLDQKKEKICRTRQFMDTPSQRRSLCLWLEELIEETGAKGLEIGMEPTGGYEIHYYKGLKEWDFKCASRVRLLPTTLVKGNQKAKGERTKTDQRSAISLAEGMISYPELEVRTLAGEERALRRIIRRIEKQNKLLQMFENELHEVLYEMMPFVIPYLKEGIPLWILKLIDKYPSARDIMKGGNKIKVPFAKPDKLREISREAGENWKKLPYDELSRYDLRNLVENIMGMMKKQKNEKKKLEELVKPMEGETVLKWLRTIPEISEYTSTVLYVELFLGGKGYDNPAKLNKYAGLDIIEIESGDHAGERRISKRGPGLVRKMLYLAAWRLTQHEPVFKEYYSRKLKTNGIQRNKALVAVMKKLLRVIWKLCTYEVAYDEEHEFNWKKKNSIVHENRPKYEKGVMEALKLPEKEIEVAPVSKRFMKKVKAATGHKLAICQTQVVTVESSPFPDSQII